MKSTTHAPSWFLMGVLSLIFFYAGLRLLPQFPSFNTDEVFIAAHGDNLLSGRGQVYGLYDDIFAPSVYPLRDVFGQILEPVYNAWVGLWVKVTQRSYVGMRLSSFVAGGLALWVIFAIGRVLGGPALGLLMSLFLAASPAFLTACCVTRPETFLLLLSSLGVWAMLRIPSSPAWNNIVIGLWAGLLVGVHPNAVALLAGFFVYEAVSGQAAEKTDRLVWLSVGMLTSLVAILCSFTAWRVNLLSKTLFADLLRPPIFDVLAHPTLVLDSLARALSTTDAYYFRAADSGTWHIAVQSWRVGLGCCLLAGLPAVWREFKSRAPQGWRSGFWMAGVAALAVSSCVQKKHEVLYDLNFYPLLLPAAAGFFQGPGLSRILRRATTTIAVGAAALGFVSMVLFVRQAIPYYTPYRDITRQFQERMTDRNLKVAGPNIFWPMWPRDKFRDTGALMYSHWYTGGQRRMGDWLGQWQPDVIVIDEPLWRVFLDNQRDAGTVSRMLGVAVTSLGTIDTGVGSYGVLEMYRVNWNRKVRGENR